MRVEIDRQVVDGMWAHARAAAPREACGLVAATRADGGAIHLVAYATAHNLAPEATRFALDPVQVAQIEAGFRRRGLRLAAVFHSHPDGPARPSREDRRMAWPGILQLICSLDRQSGGGRLRAFVCDAAGSRALPLRTRETANSPGLPSARARG